MFRSYIQDTGYFRSVVLAEIGSWDGFGSALQAFGDVCTVDLACPCLRGVLLIAPRTRPCSPSVTGDAYPSYDLEISCLSGPSVPRGLWPGSV